MALSKVQEKIETTNGLDLIWESRVAYAEILYCFRDCHDVCVESKLFKDEIILNIDQCAVDFRQLSSDTVTIAKRVSTQWLDTAIAFFTSIDDIDDPKEGLKLLGAQARELARCFKLLAAWARDLAGRFHAAQDGTIKEVEEFKQEFEAARKRADKVKKQADEEVTKAQKKLKNAQDYEEGWKTAMIVIGWFPIGTIVTGIGRKIAEKYVTEAQKLEDVAAEQLRKSKQELEKRKSENERAQYVAKKATSLLTVLGKLEEICEAIAAFWVKQADGFDAQGAKLKVNQANLIKSMKGKIVKDNIAFWTKAKDEMDRYATAMSVVNNCFNFVTQAKPPTAQSITFSNLDLQLHLPDSIDVKAITGCQ